MRASFILFLYFILTICFVWATLTGYWSYLAIGVLIVIAVITMGYADSVLLFFLGARELRPSNHRDFFEAASLCSYKLKVPLPRYYSYSGNLERAFVFQTGKTISLVLSKGLLESTTPDELKAICFELLLQVKKKMATKRTRSMFILGVTSLLVYSSVDFLLNLFPSKNFKVAVNWTISYLMNPILGIIFNFSLGDAYFKKLARHLEDYPFEKNLLNQFGYRTLKSQKSYLSLSSTILDRHSFVNGRHYQNVLLMEFLPHEWDFFFKDLELVRAE